MSESNTRAWMKNKSSSGTGPHWFYRATLIYHSFLIHCVILNRLMHNLMIQRKVAVISKNMPHRVQVHFTKLNLFCQLITFIIKCKGGHITVHIFNIDCIFWCIMIYEVLCLSRGWLETNREKMQYNRVGVSKTSSRLSLDNDLRIMARRRCHWSQNQQQSCQNRQCVIPHVILCLRINFFLLPPLWIFVGEIIWIGLNDCPQWWWQ